MNCKSCHHKCHCDNELHADEYGICVCDDCKCNKPRAERDLSGTGSDLGLE